MAPHAQEEEHRRGLRQSESRRRGGVHPAGHHSRVVSDQDLPAEPRGRERAGEAALPEHRAQQPSDPDARDGHPQTPVLLHLAARPAPHQPRPRANSVELRGDGGPRSDHRCRRTHGHPRDGLAGRVAARAWARRGLGSLAPPEWKGECSMSDQMTALDGASLDVEDRTPGRRPRYAVTALPLLRSRLAPFALAVALALAAAPAVTLGQLPVIDAANLIQTTMTTLKMVESVINEVEMIANQIRQIENMMQNTRNFGRGIWDTEALPRLVRLGQVIDQEQAVAYSMANIDGLFRQRYPGYRPVTHWSREYDTWTRTTLDTLRGTLNSVRLHAGDFATEQGRIQALQAMSDSAEGRMQALQLGNMMAGEQLQQLVKLRQLVMAQINAQNVYMATQTNREAQRAATQSEWVRNGNADAPPIESTAAGRSRGVAPRR